MAISRFEGNVIDYTSSKVNIDTLCDVLVSTQIEMGQTPTLKKAEYDNLGKKIRRFKRDVDNNVIDTRTNSSISDEKTKPMVKSISSTKNETKSNTSKCNDCSSCNSNCSKSEKHEEPIVKKKKGLFERGFNNFFAGIYEDDDDDDTYICEYCTELGYSGKYKAYICDNCTKCEGCAEYSSGTCDGCTYSAIREGKPYSETLPISEILDESDLEIINNIKGNSDKNETNRRIHKGFSILDH